MDTQALIDEFKDYFSDKNYKRISKYINKKRKWIKIDFLNLSLFNPELSDAVLENPEELIKIAEIALEQFNIYNGQKVRFFNLPKSRFRNVWEIRGEDVGKFISLNGIINKNSSIIHVCKSAKFECPNCGAIIPVIMIDGQYKEPTKCGCGRKGKMKCLSKEMSDNIKLGLMDDLMDEENKDRNMAREKLAVLEDDLTCKDIDKELKPGRKVILNGFFTYIQKIKGNKKTAEFESLFMVNSIEFVEVGWQTIKITDEEKEEFKQLSKDSKLITKLANSVADVKGYDEAKVACLLLLVGSPLLKDENNHLTSRSTIHVLLIGDPGASKTYLAKRVGAICPIYSFQSAATASGKGLVASVAQDKDMGTWVIYPGVVAMAHKGCCVIDEIDKTAEEDYGDHNNAMNDMEVPIAKANVKGVLDTETSYLATANPAEREFHSFESFYKQINMPKDFIDRFDIIFPIVTPTGEEEKSKIMDVMLERHSNGKVQKRSWVPDFSHDYIRKYISYCRREKPKPELDPVLFKTIKNKLHELMNPKNHDQVKISFRQLESILRFAYASARLHLRDITEEDIDVAFKLKQKSFEGLGIISDAGFDWGKMEGIEQNVITTKKRLLEIMNDLLPHSGDMVSIGDILSSAKEHDIADDEVYDFVDKRKAQGDYYEPKRGYIRKI